MINLRWSAMAATAAFIISLVLGLSVRGRILIILIRAFCFAVVFFLLAVLIWRLINKYIPELLHIPSPDDNSLAPGIEPEGRVNITVGDGEDSIPPNAALPPEDRAGYVGNIADVMNRGPSPSAGVNPAAASPDFSRLSPEALSPAVSVPAQGMDQGLQSGYTQNRDNVSRISSPSVQSPAGGFSDLGDTSGGIESLPDLDALAGSFLSPAAAGEDSVLAGQGSSPAGRRAPVKKRPGSGGRF